MEVVHMPATLGIGPSRETSGPRRRRSAIVAAAFAAASLFLPAIATASTTYTVTAHFVEPIAPPVDCPITFDGFCGTGRVTPFGKATDMIDFGVGCGGACDVRTIYLSAGTLVLNETFSDPACPGSCHQNPASPQSGTLSDVVISGTGIFAGATGTLTGSVKAAGDWIPAGESQITLSGILVLAQ
jgi:hypothetical protein